MITDIFNIPPETCIDCDVCIIGGGAAGIAIARDLMRTNLRVILLESGGASREDKTQNLYAGSSVGETYYQQLHDCRTRYLGGSTNCWGAIFTPLNPIDFEQRDWVPFSGWPVSYRELQPWVEQAHHDYGFGPFSYGEEAWDAAGIPSANFDRTTFERFVWHFNSRSAAKSFAKRYRQELRTASNIHVLLHANATELLTDESGRQIQKVLIRTFNHEERQVSARIFVLACGGIENARLLLASSGTQKNGLGNDRDLVGRFFHEHLQMPIGYLLSDRPLAARYSYLSRFGPTFCLPGLVLSPQAQSRFRVLNASVSIDPVYDTDGAWMAFQRLRADLWDKAIGRQTLRHLWKVCCESNKFAPEAWRRVVKGHRARGLEGRFMVYARAEQAPNSSSRVRLSPETDPLGMPRACLDWRTSDIDRGAIKLLSSLVSNEFQRLGLGYVQEQPWPEDALWPEGLAGGPHHMGTTRMSDDPSTGVVNRDCQVHGVDGLYIAGSSVFPTGGHANPTLSILALAGRLAAHVRERLGCGVFGSQSPAYEDRQYDDPLKSAAAVARLATARRDLHPASSSLIRASSH